MIRWLLYDDKIMKKLWWNYDKMTTPVGEPSFLQQVFDSAGLESSASPLQLPCCCCWWWWWWRWRWWRWWWWGCWWWYGDLDCQASKLNISSVIIIITVVIIIIIIIIMMFTAITAVITIIIKIIKTWSNLQDTRCSFSLKKIL